MAIQLNDLLGFLGIQDVEEYVTGEKGLDDFKVDFGKTFLSYEKAKTHPDIIKPIEIQMKGKYNSIPVQEIDKIMREVGLEFTQEEVSALKDDRGNIPAKAYIALYADKRARHEEKIREEMGGNVDVEKINADWQSKYDLKLTEAKIASETAEKAIQEREAASEKHKQEFSAFRIDTEKRNLYDNLGVSKDVDPLKVDGFKSRMHNDYVYGWDEKENKLTMLRQDGQPEFNENESRALEPSEIWEKRALEHKMIPVNNNGAEPISQPISGTGVPRHKPGEGGNWVHPNARV